MLRPFVRSQSLLLGTDVLFLYLRFFEYLFKAYVLFGDREFYDIFIKAMQAVGRKLWMGMPPVFINVDMRSGNISNYWIDSLQAYFPGLLAYSGIVELDVPMRQHAAYYSLWSRYHAMPERFDWRSKTPTVSFYPLRPELAESTYHLFRVTKDPFYLDVGRHMLCDIEKHMKVRMFVSSIQEVLNSSQLLWTAGFVWVWHRAFSDNVGP